ncbi:hypothetical protein LXL04_005085 [Taraxacum kok-saghyz]
MISFTHSSFYKAWAAKNRWSEDLLCKCDRPATFSISITEDNPGRKFRGCPNYQDKYNKCDFFLWLDPPLPNSHYKEIIWKLYCDLENANAVKESQLQMLKLLKVLVMMMCMVLFFTVVFGVVLVHQMKKVVR